MAAERRRRARLSRSGDFDRVYRDGLSQGNRFIVLHAFPRADADDEVRLGISVGRKVGGAADRNTVKRALREAFWACADGLPTGHDFVLVAKADALDLVEREGTPGIEAALGELIEAAGLTRRSV